MCDKKGYLLPKTCAEYLGYLTYNWVGSAAIPFHVLVLLWVVSSCHHSPWVFVGPQVHAAAILPRALHVVQESPVRLHSRAGEDHSPG
jgi:hypothetical protein